MADISQYLQAIMSAVYGEDVRSSIHDAIDIINQVSEVVMSTGTAVTGPTSSSTGFFTDSLYLNTNTQELWKCTGTDTWASQGTLKGNDGRGITSITKTSTSGLVDTYTILYSDTTTSTFAVTNGKDGNQWYRGTGISGKAVSPTVYSGSGVANANPNDFYLNPSEGAIYHCVTGGNAATATWSYDFTLTGGGGGASALTDLTDVSITTPANGQCLRYNNSLQMWVNSDMPREYTRYLGKVNFAQLTSAYLVETNLNGFVTCVDGGTLTSAMVGSGGTWASTFHEGDVIPPGSHIAVVNDGTTANPDYRFDDFGGYVDLSGLAEKNVVTTTRFSISTTGWIADTTSQSGVTLYKKSVSINHIYKNCPDISIGAAAGLPSTAEQEAYDLLKYVTVDDTVPCLYLYASAIPTNGFYINAEGVD